MWIDVQYQQPTEGDGDIDGDVLWLYGDRSVITGRWDLALDGRKGLVIAWMPIPEFTALPEIPAGYRLLRADEYDQPPAVKSMYLSSDGGWRYMAHYDSTYQAQYKYIVPVKPQYRPFRDMAEFGPYRERWWRMKRQPWQVNPPHVYRTIGYSWMTWREAFDDAEFDDGTPFGIEVTE